jgi:hypothetical protein
MGQQNVAGTHETTILLAASNCHESALQAMIQVIDRDEFFS